MSPSVDPGNRPTMSQPIVTRDQAADAFEVATSLLARYERRGLVRVVRRGAVEGYEPTEIRRLWTVVSLHRDLGINLAGVEAILRLRDHMDDLHGHLARLADELRDLAEAPTGPDADG